MNRLIHFVLPLVVTLSSAGALSASVTPSTGHHEEAEVDTAPPSEPFTEGAQAFQAAKEQLLKGYYRDTLTEDDLYRAAVKGMLERIDPTLKSYNQLLSPKTHQELKNELKGQITGIGVTVKIEEDSGLVDVLGIVPGSPASGAGLVAGDRIVSVDGKSFKGQPFMGVVSAIRGPEGQNVRLEIIHDGQVITKNIRRGQVVWEPVHVQMYPGNIVHLGLSDFSERSPDALRKALASIAAQKPKGVVIDLRQNHGGVFEQSIVAANLLLPSGTPIAEIVHRGGRVEKLTADGSDLLPSLPAVVLIDNGTASSAEMLASALRNGLHAPLIGSTSKGKWSIQTLEELPNHYVMKYTVGVFRTPDSKTYEGVGLSPDVEVPLDDAAADAAMALTDPTARLAADGQLRAGVNLLRMRP